MSDRIVGIPCAKLTDKLTYKLTWN